MADIVGRLQTDAVQAPERVGEEVWSLDGTWDLFPGDHRPDALDGLVPRPIRVPGLWEAQGFLDLDGVAWYRRRFWLDDPRGHWTLRFGAVMDLAEVHLNGRLLGGNDLPFTPFELDPSGALAAGVNELAVRVTDPPVDGQQHRRLPHGKQGWANHVFPSPPSVYMTYGGIWQPVTLRRHGPVAVREALCSSDPDDLTFRVRLENLTGDAVTTRLAVTTVGLAAEADVELGPGAGRETIIRLGRTGAARWRPDRAVLHRAEVRALVGGTRSDLLAVRYGLRRLEVEGHRLLIDGEPYRMRSALVQGFRADTLYAEGDPGAIREEVAAAKAMGLNTLRLHIKAFDPAYLDVCDELGMLLHCDMPVAEPIAHDELGPDGELADRCARAADAQVRRDANRPSVILWSAMNELGLEAMEVRGRPGYEGFVRRVAGAVAAADPTRPLIENDWIEPDPERVFTTPVLVAHWYGRLHAGWLAELDARARRWAGLGRPLFVTEFGDWGLPELPDRDDPPFWWPGGWYRAALAELPWPGSAEEFIEGTQRHQGLSDRLQAEVLRRHDHIGGWCLTELTDVPWELNGLLDLERRPKPAAVAELALVGQDVLPMLELPSLTVPAGGRLAAPLHVANDGPPLTGVTVEATLAGAAAVVEVGHLEGRRAARTGTVHLPTPPTLGAYELHLRLLADGRQVATNHYPLRVVAPVGTVAPAGLAPVELVGGGPTEGALRRLGISIAAAGDAAASGAAAGLTARAVGPVGPMMVVGEGAFDGAAGALVRERLGEGGTVVVLAQEEGAAPHYPVPAALARVATAWGSTVFHFTCGQRALPSLPERAVLAGEDATFVPTHLLTRLGAATWPATTLVGAFKPVPDPLAGPVVGVEPVGGGRLVTCQYRLAEPAGRGDPAAVAVLGELLRWAAAGAR
jgi:glycosyl hydrolase family 2